MCEKERKSTVSVRETEDKNKYQCTCPYVRTNNQVTYEREREREREIGTNNMHSVWGRKRKGRLWGVT